MPVNAALDGSVSVKALSQSFCTRPGVSQPLLADVDPASAQPNKSKKKKPWPPQPAQRLTTCCLLVVWSMPLLMLLLLRLTNNNTPPPTPPTNTNNTNNTRCRTHTNTNQLANNPNHTQQQHNPRSNDDSHCCISPMACLSVASRFAQSRAAWKSMFDNIFREFHKGVLNTIGSKCACEIAHV